MGTVPGCTRAELPQVAEGVQGQMGGLIRVTSLESEVQKVAQGCAEVHRDVWRCAEMHGGVQKGA